MKYWYYYIIALATLFHPHLWQKLNILMAYLKHSEFEFWTTFSVADFFDLILHAGFPLIFILLGVRKQVRKKY
jgi:hypothetical protein